MVERVGRDERGDVANSVDADRRQRAASCVSADAATHKNNNTTHAGGTLSSSGWRLVSSSDHRSTLVTPCQPALDNDAN